jgi:type VI secretion system protein ImpA
VHPQLDADDDDDPTERVNALLGLVDDQGMLRQIRRAPLTDGKMMGKYSLRHLSVAKGEMSLPADMDEMPTDGIISAAFQDTSDEKMAAIRDGLEASIEHVTAIAGILDEKVPLQSPDLEPLLVLLKTGLNAARAEAGEVELEVESGSASIAGTAPVAASSGGGVAGINGPGDVTRAIDLILEYYRRSEPSSPLPLILERAKRLVAADFMTIIKDIASTAEDEVRQIGGIPTDDY